MSNDQDTSNITQMNPYSDIRTVKAVLYMPPTLLVKASAEISDIHTKQTSIVADYNNLTIESSCTEEAFSVEYQIRHILQKHLPNSDSSVPIVSYGGVYPRAEIRSRFPETTPAGLYSGNSNQEMVTEENKVINETSYAQGEGGEVQRFPETTPAGLYSGNSNQEMVTEENKVINETSYAQGEGGEVQRFPETTPAGLYSGNSNQEMVTEENKVINETSYAQGEGGEVQRFPETTPAGLYSGNSNQEMVTEENKVINETSYAQGEGGEVQRFPETTPAGLYSGNSNQEMVTEENKVINETSYAQGEGGEVQRFPETTPPGLDVGHLNRSMFSEEISVVEVSDDENGESGEEQRLSGGSDDEKKKKKKERNKKKRELKKRKKEKSKGQSVSSNSHNSILSGEKTRPGLVKRVRKIDEPARYDPFCGNSRDGRHGEAIEYQTVNGKWVRSGAVDDHGREIYPDLSTSTSDKAVQDKKKVVDTRKQGKAISAQSLTNSVPPPSNKQSQAVPAQPQTPKPAPAQKSVVPEVERFVSKANVKKTERKEGATTAGIVTPGTVSKTSITPQKQNEEEERSEYFRRAGSERRQKPQENKEARKLKLFTNPLLMGAPKF